VADSFAVTMRAAFGKPRWQHLRNVMILQCRDRKFYTFQKDLVLEGMWDRDLMHITPVTPCDVGKTGAELSSRLGQ
jgi:hypothetical protein